MSFGWRKKRVALRVVNYTLSFSGSACVKSALSAMKGRQSYIYCFYILFHYTVFIFTCFQYFRLILQSVILFSVIVSVNMCIIHIYSNREKDWINWNLYLYSQQKRRLEYDTKLYKVTRLQFLKSVEYWVPFYCHYPESIPTRSDSTC